MRCRRAVAECVEVVLEGHAGQSYEMMVAYLSLASTKKLSVQTFQ